MSTENKQPDTFKYYLIYFDGHPVVKPFDDYGELSVFYQNMYETKGIIATVMYGEDITGTLANFAHRKRMGMVTE